MIKFDNVTKVYNNRDTGIKNVSIKIKDGDFVFLVGPSGSGKSTFIKLITKELEPDSGTITVNGRKLENILARDLPMHRRRIGMVFQDFRLLPKKTVFENVAFGMEVLHKSNREIKKKVPQFLRLVGIGNKANKYPDELSAGEQQRVAIARAMINNPSLIVADEPTGNLDPDTAWEIMLLLEQINKQGTTIVMVTHAKDIVDKMGKRVIAIEKGRIVRDDVGNYIGDDEEDTYDESEDFDELEMRIERIKERLRSTAAFMDGGRNQAGSRKQANAPAPQPSNAPSAQQANAPAPQQANTSAARTANAPASRPVNAPSAQPSNAPAPQQANTSAARTANAPAARSVNTPSAQQANASAAQPANAPSVQQAGTSAARTANAPAARSVNAPSAQPANASSAQPVNTPAPQQASTSAARTANAPAARSVNAPAAQPANIPAPAAQPANSPDAQSSNIPGVRRADTAGVQQASGSKTDK